MPRRRRGYSRALTESNPGAGGGNVGRRPLRTRRGVHLPRPHPLARWGPAEWGSSNPSEFRVPEAHENPPGQPPADPQPYLHVGAGASRPSGGDARLPPSPARAAGLQSRRGDSSPGKGWVFTLSLKPAEEPPLGPWPETHSPEKVQVKMGQTEFVPWYQARLAALGRTVQVEGRWPDTPILQGEGRQRCSAQSPDRWQELLPRPDEETAPSPSLARAGNLGTAWPGR